MRDVLAIVLGGLGTPQTLSIIQALRVIPGVFVWSPGRKSEYTADVAQAVELFPSRQLVGIFHSFACQTGIEACDQVRAKTGRRFDYFCIEDPVSHDPLWADEMEMPAAEAAPICSDLFYAETAGALVRRAKIIGAESKVIAGTTHNTLPHNPEVIAAIVARVQALGAA
jgi:hypothetical protein